MARTVLIVEDSASVRQLVRITLGEAGYSVVEAVDGLEGLEKATATSFDLVVTGIDMPMLSGLELLQALRNHDRCRETPILLLTSESSPELKERARALGATGWLVKPFDPQQLLAVVDKVVGPATSAENRG